MADILTLLPFMSVDEYLWGHSAAFIRITAYDKSRTRTLSKKEIERRKKEKENARNRVASPEDIIKRLGMMGNPAANNTFTGDWKQAVMEQQQKHEEETKNQEPKTE